MPLSPGTLLGHYKIRSVLGAGGMGEVFLAEDVELERLVALKVLHLEVAQDTERIRRFVLEAKATSALNHPNILTIYEIGQTADSRFITSELIKGITLRQRLRQEPLSLRESLEITLQVGAALNAAHQAGVVHRDIKPENIMLRDDGLVKVLDFGLAKLTVTKTEGAVDGQAPTIAEGRTEPGMMMGTVAYMSPEQARGREVDARTDIWALGVCLYEMLSGTLPFTGETAFDIIAAVLKSEPPLVEGAPAELQRIVRKALQKERDERYQTVKDLLIDLRGLKRELEFAEEIERSHIPSLAMATDMRTAHQRSMAATTARNATGVATRPSEIYRQSSAEYLVGSVKRHKPILLGALTGLVILLAVGSYLLFFAPRAQAVNSIAVLPFTHTTGEADTEYLADGISESLINSLSQLPQLKVIARSSAFKYKGKEVDTQEVARALGVQAIVTGRIVERGDNLQISVEMVKASDKSQMWGAQYSRKAADLQAVEEEITRTISEKLRVRLSGAQEQQLAKRATQDARAYQLYLQGLFHARQGGVENARKALDFYNQAIALDPDFALAYATLTDFYGVFASNGLLDPKVATAKAKEAAQTALRLDNTLAEAHAALANIKMNEWDWAGAESEYRRAIELNPNLAIAHFRYSQFLPKMGRFTDALNEIKRVQELDPLRSGLKSQEGIILFYARRYDEAIEKLQQVVAVEPNYSFAHSGLGYAYVGKGQYAEAIDEYQKTIELEGPSTSMEIYLGHAYALSGRRDEALSILDRMKTTEEYVSPAELAVLHIGLGDKERAFDALERAHSERDLQLQYLKVDPAYDPLRSDPRFANLLSRVGLTP